MYAGPSKNPEDLVQPAVQANKEHQYALKVYTERLEAELEHLDKLLAATEVSDDDEEEVLVVNSGGNVFIPGAAKPRGLIPLNVLTEESSPFYSDVIRRQRYESFTISHPMKAQELEALADAVHSENYRLHALEAQARGVPPFISMGDPPPDFTMNKEGIDWERVAQKVSSASMTVQRTAKECEIRWLGERHPQFNDAQWTKSEIAKVKELVGSAGEGEVDWVEISEKLGTGRTPVDCMRHAITRRTHTWTPDADRRLLEAVDVYGTDSWPLVARAVSEDATGAQCQNRYLRSLDPTLKRGPWTPEEDEHLRRAAAVFGHSWIEVAAFVEGRNNEQCRERYQEYLNPSVTKGRWTEDQDSALLKAVEQVGEGKWKEVSRVLNVGRTDNMCRMRYTVLMKRNKSITLSPAPGPSGATSVATSRRSTPADTGGRPEILILHPESYYSRSAANTPGPTIPPAPPMSAAASAPASAQAPGSASELASTSAPQSKSRPRPRARRKQPTPEGVSGTGSDLGAEGSSTTQREQPATEPYKATSEPEPTADSSKRRVSGAGGEDARSHKRQRTADPLSIPVTQPEPTMAPEGAADTIMEDGDLAPEDPQPEDAQEVETLNASDIPGRGSGKGRGRGRSRGRGRGRSKSLGRRSDAGRDEEERVGDVIATDVSMAQPEPGSSTGPSSGRRTVVSRPTRRQPPRAANKASRPGTKEDDAP